MWACTSVLPLSCYVQVDGLISLSFDENEATIKLMGLLHELHETTLPWHLPEYELSQYEFIVSHVLSKRTCKPLSGAYLWTWI